MYLSLYIYIDIIRIGILFSKKVQEKPAKARATPDFVFLLPKGTLEYLDHLILPNLAASINSTATNRTMLDAARDLYSRSSMSERDYQECQGRSGQVIETSKKLGK